MLKKLSLVMACCVALNTPGMVNAATTNTRTSSMTTVSGIRVSIKVPEAKAVEKTLQVTVPQEIA